jgi:hypothetical protein
VLRQHYFLILLPTLLYSDQECRNRLAVRTSNQNALLRESKFSHVQMHSSFRLRLKHCQKTLLELDIDESVGVMAWRSTSQRHCVSPHRYQMSTDLLGAAFVGLRSTTSCLAIAYASQIRGHELESDSVSSAAMLDRQYEACQIVRYWRSDKAVVPGGRNVDGSRRKPKLPVGIT